MRTRRTFLAGLGASVLAVHSSSANSRGEQLLFVGTGAERGSKGIYTYRFDSANGALESIGLAAETPAPSFLALSPDRRFLFAVNEIATYEDAKPGQRVKTGAVNSFALEQATGKLTLINTVASAGAGPCHITTDHTGRVLLVANYTGGSAASFQIGSDGRLSEAVSEFHYESHGPLEGQDKERQEASHAHHATPSPENRFVFINDLGLDCIHIYRLDPATAKLSPSDPLEWKAGAGSGPRVLRFHPGGRWAYCVNELSSTVDLLAWDSSSGTLSLIEKTPLVAPDFKGVTRAAEIIFDGKGRFAYVANRDNDFLATFGIDSASGKLGVLRRSPCGGKIPRHIALDPTEQWILVANQNSNNIAVFRRDAKTGVLAMDGPSAPIQSPQCLLFA